MFAGGDDSADKYRSMFTNLSSLSLTEAPDQISYDEMGFYIGDILARLLLKD